LRRRLVVPGTPALPRIHADANSLIGAEDHTRGFGWVDPKCVIVVTARSALQSGESLASVHRAIQGNIGQVDHIRIAGIDYDLAEIPQSPANPLVGTDEGPAAARIVRTK